MYLKSDSDSTSLGSSSPTPTQPLYYVQSPSRDSSDGDKSSTNLQGSTNYNSPTESPFNSSIFGPHSRASSATSRVSGFLGSSWGRKMNRRRNEKGWNLDDVLEEEGEYDEDNYGINRGVSRSCHCLIGLIGFASMFTLFCLIIWGASRPYKARVAVKSMRVHNFDFGQGSDLTGVPTKFLTVNCSVLMVIDNPATFFGIHVSSTHINLMYFDIAIGSAKLKKYYQPRKSSHIVHVNLVGNKVPLYGAGTSFAVAIDNGGVPTKLQVGIRSQGDIVGKLVKTKQRLQISCSLAIQTTGTNQTITLNQDSCLYM